MNQFIFRVFLLYVFAYTFFFASRPLSDPDFWFHLKTGEYIFQNLAFPSTEFFSFTNFGKPWIAHGWLSGLIFYLIYSRLGAYALIFIFAVLTVIAFWLVFRRLRDCHPVIAGLAILLGVAVSIPTIGVRPRVFTLLFASIFLWLLSDYVQREQKRRIWILVPLMVLWANLHGGFLIGLALIAATIIGILLDTLAAGLSLAKSWPRVRLLGVVLIGCFLAALINPYGVGIYSQPLSVMSSPVFNDVVIDWLSPNFHQANMIPLLLLILLTVVVLALSPQRAKPSELVLFLGTLYATLKAQRHMAVFALVATPLLAVYFQNWLASTWSGSRLLRVERNYSSRWATIFGLLLLIPLVPVIVKLKSTVYSPPTQERLHVPLKAVEFLKENNIHGKTFTDPNLWGAYVLWALPSNPVYIDGRDVYPEQFVREYADIISGRVDWREPFDRYAVEIVIVKPGSILAKELEKAPPWHVLYRDEMAIVFSRL
jgi:hypothetical protein